MFFFKFALFVFIAFLAVIGWIIYSFYRQIHRTVHRFKGDFQHEQEQHPNADGNIIVDQRPEAKRHRQVIKDNEGEYVDFTEE
ncbi:DUF4834 family protein [Prevotella dentasini]|uniref:DUF4834 family protein n=1 Tax=Prevotella dentasini TaxID=589537 RepID=UPI000468D483|nr:DUF4834 family protein [Prevotella dentasini]